MRSTSQLTGLKAKPVVSAVGWKEMGLNRQSLAENAAPRIAMSVSTKEKVQKMFLCLLICLFSLPRQGSIDKQQNQQFGWRYQADEAPIISQGWVMAGLRGWAFLRAFFVVYKLCKSAKILPNGS